MASKIQPFFSLSCPDINQQAGKDKKENTLIVEEDTVYEIDEECMKCRKKKFESPGNFQIRHN